MEDSTLATLKHKERVEELLTLAAEEIIARGINHDNSKLETPEKELFDEKKDALENAIDAKEEMMKDELKDRLEQMSEDGFLEEEELMKKVSHRPPQLYSIKKRIGDIVEILKIN